ncbi:hypothetical protein EKD04_025860, partial [Chloroflexales bacterium ZM16-3]|nr:hypothetical protein [Chloroflexales bacterium ZM16-3]
MNRLRLAARIVHHDLAIDAIDPVVRTWLRGVLFGVLCILISFAFATPSLLDLAVPVAMLYLLLLVEWRALRPHILFHPAVQSWIERDIRFSHAIRIAISILIFTGLLPIALLLGLLLLLGHAVLSSGIAPPPTPVIAMTAPPAIMQAAPTATLAAIREATDLVDHGRAPPATITDPTAVSTTSWPDTP